VSGLDLLDGRKAANLFLRQLVQEELATLLNKEQVESVEPPTATQELLAAQHQGSDDELNEEDLTQ
jgi:hypothetical protein